ncbi:Tex family protein [Rhodohalobacter sulfatireducens]|uniref:RNA-binding transcriptional accessory protein n=1 Tax=Rhodohalobacter sulfatireducens TaxID=2911366 RepID=A0ABS9KI99_9BACT|nr:Tex family protein [Rhodohalobacter sulfatireducens]MCG2590585.1 RNA-binding transcriptional accessory protein [Rhodohalobacter sulfatireducens]
MTEAQIIKQISNTLSLSEKQVKTTADLIDEGATIPFLARYRKEATGGLDEEQLRSIRDMLEFHRTLEDRKKTILKAIKEQDKLTPELEEKIKACKDMQTLEDLYLPYKKKRKTKGDMAKEKGLEPLAELIWAQEIEDGNPLEYAREYISEDNEIPDADTALTTSLDIVAEWINESVDVRDTLRVIMRKHGVISSKKNPAVKERTNFEDYYEFNNRVQYIKPHQTLALNRGERENVLFVNVELNTDRTLDNLDDVVIENDLSIFTPYLQDAVEDAYKRLLFPSLERELRNELTEQADEHAIQTFATNLKNLLMQPPLKDQVVMGVDPAYRTGCKVAIVNETGQYLEGSTIYPTPPQEKIKESAEVVNRYINKHDVTLIAIGNGTGSRETEKFIADVIRERKEKNPDETLNYLIISEAGASVYSASKIAREEFPDLDAAQRGNISIARRVQDPLAELVKIDPKSIGVGLYQHDINQTALSKKLDDVVESCVNDVGVNLNTASSELLTHISGLSRRVAKNIVEYREKKGRIGNRDEIKEISGVGDFRFQQAAGFLRIPEGEHPLDNTAIHPESYESTEKLCNLFGIHVESLSKEQKKIEAALSEINKKEVAGQIGVGIPTLELIIENLQKPGRDPRESLPKPLLRSDILKMEDLSPGMKLEGTVRNVVDFGAFVDIGVKQDGLLHISNMAKDKRVNDPHDVVAVGDIIDVEITNLDLERGRIGLALV